MSMSAPVSAEGYYDHDQSRLLAFVRPGFRSVLEVGCAGGALLRRLIDDGATVATGVEYVPSIAERARAACPEAKILSGDIVSFGPKEIGGDYDLAIASFVLEHVNDPWLVLKHIVDRLRPGGQFVGALPNVQHWSVTFPLIFGGKWEYVDEGIMDRTHYRFFTRSSIDELLRSAGLIDVKIEPVLLNKSALANRLTLGLASGMLTRTYEFSATKPG